MVLTVHAQSPAHNLSPPDIDPGPSNQTAHSLRNTKDSIPASEPNDSSRPDPDPDPDPAYPSPAQTTQVPTEAASVHSLPVGHVSAVHSPLQRPSTARSPPSPDTYATHLSPLHTQSSSVTVDPARGHPIRRRSTMEVNSRALCLFADSLER